MYQFSFEKLEVWQLARQFAAEIYHLTERFPKDERFGLVSQLRRASISIASNLAEGAGRTSSKDQANFYQLAYSSTLEVLNQLIISSDLNFIKEPYLSHCRSKTEELANKINALHKSAITRTNNTKNKKTDSTTQRLNE
jgi:four helix bundle protein